MSGFDRIKRTLTCVVNGQVVILFKDEDPIEIEYQKFYDNEDMFDFSNKIFKDLKNNLNIYLMGVYTLSINTLGSYIDSVVTYEIKQTITCKAIENNLNINLEYYYEE